MNVLAITAPTKRQFFYCKDSFLVNQTLVF